MLMRAKRCRSREAISCRSRRLLFEPLEQRLLLDAGPKIINITPTEVRNADFDHLDVVFNEAVASATFTSDDVAIFGATGSVDIASVTPLDATSFRINFTALAARGNYSVAIGPDIEDLDGIAMDQNEDGTNGDPETDVFATVVTYVVADTVFDSAITIAEGDATYDGQDILIDGATVTINGQHNFNSVHVIHGGVLTHSANTTDETHKLDVVVAEQFVVDATSRIDVSGKGYVAGRTTGNTTVGGATGESGGSYGGLGGVFGGSTNGVYGDYADPDDWGSGGGSGSSGGGLLRLTADTLTLHGQILANGLDIANVGAGSGGGIYVVVDTLDGGGSMQARGGNGGSREGSGGGGRIAVYAQDYADFNLDSLTAEGGSVGVQGGAGTVYVRDTNESRGMLTIDAGSGGKGWTPLGLTNQDTFVIADMVVIRGNGTQVQPEHQGLAFDFQGDLTVEDSAYLKAEGPLLAFHTPLTVGARIELNGSFNPQVPVTVSGPGSLTVSGDLTTNMALSVASGGHLKVAGTVASTLPLTIEGAKIETDRVVAPDVFVLGSGVITSLTSTELEMHKLELEVAGTILVDATSRIDVSGKGYVAGRTTGNTTVGGATGESGGSYGGLGGVFGGSTNGVYGDYADPDDWGSGGGSGSSGGGLLRLTADTLTLHGQILANGLDIANVGAGSGGGIYVVVDTLDGGGSMQARGGNGGSREGSGGGGRIAVYAQDYADFNLDSLTAEGGSVGVQGGTGTVHTVPGQPHTHVRWHQPLGINSGHVASTFGEVTLHFNKNVEVKSLDGSIAISGPLGPIPVTNVSVVGDRLYQIDFAPQSEDGYYHFAVLPTVVDVEGFQLDQNANGVPGEPEDFYKKCPPDDAICRPFTLILDTVAPRVTNHTPSGDITGTIDHVDVWFSEKIDVETVRASDVLITDPEGQIIPVVNIEEVGLNRFRFGFAPQTTVGVYHVKVGPGIADLAGNLLNQDGDDTFGEPGADVYDATFNYVPVDLAVSNIVVNPTQFWAGDALSVSWQGSNASGAALVGNWADGVYLSRDDRWDIGDHLLATVEHTDGLTQDEVYTASTTAYLPGVLPGKYYIIVRADVYNDEKEPVAGEGNNVLANGPFDLDVHELPVDGSQVAGQFAREDRANYYKLHLDGRDSLQINVSAQGGTNSLYVSYAAIPSQWFFDERSAAPRSSQQVSLTGIAGGGTYYVLVHGDQLAGTTPYTITAEVAPFLINDVTPRRHGDAAPARVTISGQGFTETTAVQFVDGDGRFWDVAEQFVSPTTLIIPQLTGLAPGTYSVRLTNPDKIAVELPNIFTVIEGGEAQLQTQPRTCQVL